MSTLYCPSRWWLPPRSHSTLSGAHLWSYIPSFSFHPHHTGPPRYPHVPAPPRHAAPPRPAPASRLPRPSSDPPRHALYVRSRSLYFRVFVCGVSSPAPHGGQCSKGEKPRSGRERSGGERRQERNPQKAQRTPACIKG